MTRLGIRKYVAPVIGFLPVAAFTLLPLAGQDYRARVQGSITDQSRAAVASAKVALKNVGTGVENVRSTDATGHFIFDFVPPGNYTVRVQMAGFNPFTQENIAVLTRGDVTIDGRSPLFKNHTYVPWACSRPQTAERTGAKSAPSISHRNGISAITIALPSIPPIRSSPERWSTATGTYRTVTPPTCRPPTA